MIAALAREEESELAKHIALCRVSTISKRKQTRTFVYSYISGRGSR